MDLSFFLDLLSTGIPSGAIMFAGLFALVVAHGGFGVKMENRSKRHLNAWGFVFLFSGFVLTFLTAIFQIWEKYKDSVLSLFSLLETSYKSFPYKIETLSSFLALFVVVLFWKNLAGIYQNRKYKLKSEFVSNKAKDKLDVLVENTSGEEIECHARISKIVIDGKKKDIKKYNPEGYYLGWDKVRQTRISDYAVLTSGVQRILYFLYIYGNEIRFELAGDEGDPLDFGKCEITIDFYRMKNRNFIKFDSFTGFITTSLSDRKEAKIEILEGPSYSIIKKAIGFLNRNLA